MISSPWEQQRHRSSVNSQESDASLRCHTYHRFRPSTGTPRRAPGLGPAPALGAAEPELMYLCAAGPGPPALLDYPQLAERPPAAPARRFCQRSIESVREGFAVFDSHHCASVSYAPQLLRRLQSLCGARGLPILAPPRPPNHRPSPQRELGCRGGAGGRRTKLIERNRRTQTHARPRRPWRRLKRQFSWGWGGGPALRPPMRPRPRVRGRPRVGAPHACRLWFKMALL